MENNQKVLVKKSFHATFWSLIKNLANQSRYETVYSFEIPVDLMEPFIKNISITVTEGEIRRNFQVRTQ